MRLPLRRRPAILAAALALPFALLPGLRSTDAAGNAQSLLAQAEHDTNTVKTLVHHDQMTVHASDGTLTMIAVGREDEVRNREEDTETVTVNLHQSTGTHKVHYNADVIFFGGKTYYKISLNGNSWQTADGTTFRDPYTGGFRRARTTVTFPKSTKFKDLGSNGGQTHLQSVTTKGTTKATTDLWISSGSHPYVVKEVDLTQDTKNTKLYRRFVTTLGPFNETQTILPPTKGSITT